MNLKPNKHKIISFNTTTTQRAPTFLQGGLSLQPNFQKGGRKGGGLERPQLLEGGCWERVGDFFKGGRCNFHIKNKLKSEIFNEKKSLYAKIFFSVITKNSNWKVLLKNLVTFKR